MEIGHKKEYFDLIYIIKKQECKQRHSNGGNMYNLRGDSARYYYYQITSLNMN